MAKRYKFCRKLNDCIAQNKLTEENSLLTEKNAI